MSDKSHWFTRNNRGKYQINSITIYQDLYLDIRQRINQNRPVDTIVQWIRQQTEQAYRSKLGNEPTTGSLNNSVGRWNEFIAMGLFCEIAIDFFEIYSRCLAVFSIENSRVQYTSDNLLSASFLNLFCENEFETNQHLSVIQQIKERIFFPSPDIIVALLEEENELIDQVQTLMLNQSLNPNSLELYKTLKGQLRAKEVLAIISIKTSNRPDRRYQPSFEAAMIKAIAHSANLDWKYYMIASELTESDRFLFETAISPHSIAVQDLDGKLVDKLIHYRRKSDLEILIEDLIPRT